MNPDEFKKKVNGILGSEIRFDGHLEKAISSIDEEKQAQIIEWVESCKSGIEKPEPCKKFKNIISFIYKSNDNKVRGILTKEKGSYFIELFLDNHKYYDRKRKYLGI